MTAMAVDHKIRGPPFFDDSMVAVIRTDDRLPWSLMKTLKSKRLEVHQPRIP